jgi:hypothetical protein
VAGGSPAFEDRISYLEECIANAESLMSEAYAVGQKCAKTVNSKWHLALDEVNLAADISPEYLKVRLLKAECLVSLPLLN